MKKFTIPLVTLLIFALPSLAQVAINKDGTSPVSGAILQIKGDSAGAPVQAMFIESETGNVGIGTTAPGFPLAFKNVLGDKISLYGQSGNHYGFGIQSHLFQIYTDSSSSDIAFGYGSSSNFTEVMRLKGNGQVAIGTSTPDASAAMEVSSTTKGWLLPNLTRAQMLAIANPAAGTYIYNTDLKTVCIYNGTKWDCMDRQSVFDAQFACGEQLVDYRDSTFYNTVKIGDQCWMAENLNVGTQINSNADQLNNDTIEKYCYNDSEDSCSVYGGLYQWNEMMQYVTTAGAQGICPTGWHIPTDNDWKSLEMDLGMSQASADSTGWRGTDEGGQLKNTSYRYWNSPNTGATNSSGFKALGAGTRTGPGTFGYLKIRGIFWSSSLSNSNPLFRRLNYNVSTVYRSTGVHTKGVAVRCVKD